MPRNKRRRSLSGSEHDDEEKPIRHPELWMDDGSVILQAENTQFRIHRTMLSRYSPVFRDMFSIPRPTTGSDDTIDGCDVVRLTDSAEDVSCFLSALYNHELYTVRGQRQLPFPVVAAMLRLGSKYDFEHLREEALFRLCAEFPTTLRGWDKSRRSCKYITERPGLLFDVINLALEQGLVSILPMAYLCCIENGTIEEIFDGWTREDGSKVVLFPEAQRACVVGIQKILGHLVKATLSWVKPDADGFNSVCGGNRRRCAMTRHSFAASIFEPSALGLQTWEEVHADVLCEACCESARAKYEEGRLKMWEMMPENFGFPPWDELKKLDRWQS